MFNVLSGLQEGSRSVVVVSRASNGATFVKGDVVVTSGGKLSAAGAADAMFLEFVFEDLTGNSSGKYTVIYGSMEAETDNIDDTGSGAGSGAIVADSPLSCLAGKIVKGNTADLAAPVSNIWGKCIAVSTVVDLTKGGSGTKTITFRTRN